MGWKNIKEHYRIIHIVQVTDEGICIGSGYIPDLIVIGLDGELKKRYGDSLATNVDLVRYQQEMDADPETLRALVKTPDTFSKSITVYTYEDDAVLEKQCEEPGWPSATHDGCLMYENRFSTDKAKVVEWAKNNNKAAINLTQDYIERLEKDLAAAKVELAQHETIRVKLEQEYPVDALSASA